MKRAPHVHAIALAVAIALAGSARADDAAHRRAAESFRQAQAAFERRDFAAAAAAFEQAAQFEPHPAPLLNAADAWERAGDPAHAADDCDRALALPNASDAHKNDAEQCLRRLTPRLATLDFRGPSTIAISVDGGPQLIVPLRRRVVPGHHAITVVDLGTSVSRRVDVDVRGGDVRAVDVAPGIPSTTVPVVPSAEPAPPRPAPESPSRSRGVPTSTWIAFGIGGAAAAVATTFGLFAVSMKSNFDGGDTTQTTADTFHRDKAIANIAWSVAGIAAATGVILWIAAPRAPGGAAVGVVPGPSGAAIVGTLRFR